MTDPGVDVIRRSIDSALAYAVDRRDAKRFYHLLTERAEFVGDPEGLRQWWARWRREVPMDY